MVRRRRALGGRTSLVRHEAERPKLTSAIDEEEEEGRVRAADQRRSLSGICGQPKIEDGAEFEYDLKWSVLA